MSDNNEDNVFSLRPELDPLKRMEAHEWGRELYKSYLISCLGLPSLAADHKASLISKDIAETISKATFIVTEKIIEEMNDEINKAEVEHLKNETAVKQMADLIREEMVRQAESICFWDIADQDLLQGGKPEIQEHLISDTPIVDRFDFEEIARKVLR